VTQAWQGCTVVRNACCRARPPGFVQRLWGLLMGCYLDLVSKYLRPVTKYLRKQLEGGWIYFVSWFQSLQSMTGWLHCFWAMVRQNIMAEGCGRALLLTSWWIGSTECLCQWVSSFLNILCGLPRSFFPWLILSGKVVTDPPRESSRCLLIHPSWQSRWTTSLGDLRHFT
jgi:hypothetical protein